MLPSLARPRATSSGVRRCQRLHACLQDGGGGGSSYNMSPHSAAAVGTLGHWLSFLRPTTSTPPPTKTKVYG